MPMIKSKKEKTTEGKWDSAVVMPNGQRRSLAGRPRDWKNVVELIKRQGVQFVDLKSAKRLGKLSPDALEKIVRLNSKRGFVTW